jgi:hypothetical protein
VKQVFEIIVEIKFAKELLNWTYWIKHSYTENALSIGKSGFFVQHCNWQKVKNAFCTNIVSIHRKNEMLN